MYWPKLTVYLRVSSQLLAPGGGGVVPLLFQKGQGSRTARQSEQQCKAQRAHNGGTWAHLPCVSVVVFILNLQSIYNLSNVHQP